jgi:hypothetical protein
MLPSSAVAMRTQLILRRPASRAPWRASLLLAEGNVRMSPKIELIDPQDNRQP